MLPYGVGSALLCFMSAALALAAPATDEVPEFSFKQYPDGTAKRGAFVELQGPVRGNITFVQIGEGPVVIFGEVTGLAPGKHGFHIHQNGNITGGCAAAGPHFNPENKKHGDREASERHVGDLGNIIANELGVAVVRMEDRLISLTGPHGVLGRTVVVHSHEDDLGLGGYPDSLTTGHAGDRVACGIIKIKFPPGPWTESSSSPSSASSLRWTAGSFALALIPLARLL